MFQSLEIDKKNKVIVQKHCKKVSTYSHVFIHSYSHKPLKLPLGTEH